MSRGLSLISPSALGCDAHAIVFGGEEQNSGALLAANKMYNFWALSLADFGAQAYGHAHSFMLWFLDLAGSVPREI